MAEFLTEMQLVRSRRGSTLSGAKGARAVPGLCEAGRATEACVLPLAAFTDCRLSEALEVHPGRLLIEERSVVFRTLKQRSTDNQGNINPARFRAVPVPDQLINDIDLVFDLSRLLKSKRQKDQPLWPMARTTVWLTVKRVMVRAEIEGPMATTKGLRHGLGTALAAEKVSATAILDIPGHTDTKTTEIYTRAVRDELRELASRTWTCNTCNII